MNESRERRRKEQQKQERTGLKALSSLGLTPGTSLMALIQQSLAFYICRRLESERWQHVQWELSGANVQVGPIADLDECQVVTRAPRGCLISNSSLRGV